MVAMYLELNSPRRRDSNAPSYQPSPYRPASPLSPMMGTPKAQQKAYQNTIPILPAAQPLSAAIDRYIHWMTCQGIEIPTVDMPCSTPDFVAPVARTPRQSTPRSKPVKEFPNGILHTPRSLKPRTLGKGVRWRDHETNKKNLGCFAGVCGGEAALVEVQDEFGVVHSSIPIQRTPTPSPRSRDDPILSFREMEMSAGQSTARQRDHYEADTFTYREKPLKRSSSPHPRAQPSSQSSPPTPNRPISMRRAPSPHPIAMRRAPSPHPKMIERQQNQGLPFPDSRRQESQQSRSGGSRSASPALPMARRARVRGQSPGPSPATSPTAHRSPQSASGERPSPRAFGMRRMRSREPSAEPPQRRRERSESPSTNQMQRSTGQNRGSNNTPQRDPPSSNNRPPQRGTDLRRTRSSSRQGQEEPKRFAELPKKEKRFSGELPGKESYRVASELPGKEDTQQFAEIVWKSKEEPVVIKEEKKKKGWKLVRKSSRKQPQPESPQWQRSEEDAGGWVNRDKNSITEDDYDRYGSNY